MEKKAVRGKKVDVKCKCCPKVTQVRQADLNRGWGLYCSKSCKAFWQKYGRERQAPTGEHKKADRAFNDLQLQFFLSDAGITNEQYEKLKKAGCRYVRQDENGEYDFTSEQLRILGASEWEISEAEHQEALADSEPVHDW